MNPYIAVVFANRNDGYTLDQEKRIRKFIEYYSYYNEKYDGLFEFIICDWNPPVEKKPLRDAYNWDDLGYVSHLTVSSEIHRQLCPDNSRPILDYTARNVCIRRASAPFILVINQDIFLSSSILEFLSRRALSDQYFYRADRCDFEFDYDQDFKDWAIFDEYAKKRALYKHIRPTSYNKPMSQELNSADFDRIYTQKKQTEYKLNTIIYSDFYSYFRKIYNGYYNLLRCFNRQKDGYFQKFFLHTNASGDFLIAPKKAFYDVNGFVETYRFYMHLDSYICIQLFSAGYKQAILAHPHTVFHSHHSRSAREGRSESMGYLDHTREWDQICLGKRSYKINPESWGLGVVQQ